MSQFPGPGPQPTARRGPLIVVAVAGGVVVLLLIAVTVLSGIGYLGMRATAESERKRADQIARQAPATPDVAPVLAAGRKDAETAFTYDSAHLDAFVSSVKAVSTAAFVAKFTPSVAAIKQQSAQHPSATGKVVDLAVRELTGTTAELLVFADITTKSAARPEPAINRVRLQVQLQRAGDRWLLNDLTSV